jgi:hypothetical protein
MERPTSALHLTRVTLTVRALNAEPHTKKVGHDAVYYHHCVRSARGHDGGGGTVAEDRTPAVHSLSSDIPTIERFVERVKRQGAVACCYEAGPCGFELQRALTAHQIPCEVIARP